ncbi:MAGUK p55 subfamily member 4-like isoform X2 [Triplophysa dalaica]|uniref:MAGUK p55 subfamily member 4-like isoform X2 n=1 Tax=Triplophysa dalaica TaxID=1582913 RepID=UPI0024DFAF06|nr:MAGUK p55 subfamily member 4-like isoform X2 [Triplophysa dalaica]
MRPAIESDPVSGPIEMGDNGLTQILAHVVSGMRGSINKDINGVELLQSLLSAPWLQSLLKIYECLQQHLKHSPRPHLSYSSGLSLQILSDLMAISNPSDEARELYSLLSQPHLQALLSAHDTVGLRDYEPELPPLPKDLPEDEEAMRIVCLVKNNQPLIRASPGFRSHWDTLRQATHSGSFSAGGRWEKGLDDMLKGPCGYKSVSPNVVPSFNKCCLNSHGNALWEQSLSCCAPSACNSNATDDVDSDVGHTLSPWTPSTSRRCHAPSKTIPHARTAPPSPRHCHRESTACSHIRSEKEEGLDELWRTLKHAGGCIERSSENIQLLGERMLAASDRMSESMQENSEAMTLLTHVVEKLQKVVAAENSTSVVHSEVLARNATPGNACKNAVARNACAVGSRWGGTSLSVPNSPALASSTRNSRCSVGSSSSSSSSSIITLQQQPMISKERCFSHASNDGSINGRVKGATIRRDDVTGEIYIARVIHGGLADRSGLLHAGDRLVEVNGHPVFGLEPEQIIQILVHSHTHTSTAHSQGTIMFKVVPITDRPVNNQTMLFMRAMVDYNPLVDPSIPCTDAGMAFRKGEILEIVDQTDALWWQAIKLPSISSCAGLIPSTKLLKRKQKEVWWSQPYQPHTCVTTLTTVDEEEDIAIDDKCIEADEEAFESESEFCTNVDGIYLTGFRRSLRLCRRRRGQAFGTSQFCSLRCPTSCYSSLSNSYEEVVRYQHHPEHTHRLIVLVGPSGVGVNELRRRLIEINPKVYQGAVPHTTRPPKCHEESGREYHFVSKEQFDKMIYNRRFIEFGEFEGHLYGTCVDAVKDVLAGGKICVIDIEPYALESVRSPELRAYVIFIKPPPAEQMKHTRMNSHIITNYFLSRPFKDEDIQEIEDAGHKMQQQYCQFFDHVIVNDGLQAACVQLLTAVRRAQDEPQWVPAAWIKPSEQS